MTTLLTLNANQNIPSGGAGSVISWDVVVSDSVGAYNSLQPTRITVPSGVTQMRMTSNAVFTTNSSGVRQVYSRLNGSLYPTGYLSQTAVPVGGGSSTSMSNIGPWIPVTAGDYWELVAYQNSGVTLGFGVSKASWFQAEWK